MNSHKPQAEHHRDALATGMTSAAVSGLSSSSSSSNASAQPSVSVADTSSSTSLGGSVRSPGQPPAPCGPLRATLAVHCDLLRTELDTDTADVQCRTGALSGAVRGVAQRRRLRLHAVELYETEQRLHSRLGSVAERVQQMRQLLAARQRHGAAAVQRR